MIADNWVKYRNFDESELRCKCEMCQEESAPPQMQRRVMWLVQAMRDIVRRPIIVTSGYRCAAHNATVSTCTPASNSPHVEGWAIDVACASSAERYELIDAAIRAGVRRIGIGKNFLHIDCDPTKPPGVAWLY